MMFKLNKRFFAAILAVALLFSNQGTALATGMEDIPGEYMESMAAELTEPVETTEPVDTTEPTDAETEPVEAETEPTTTETEPVEAETEPTTTETEPVEATEPTETEEETVPTDPWLRKLVSFKGSYPYLWSDPSNVNSQILTDAKNFPAKMRVVDSYAFSDTTTLYKLATADDSQWPADLADFVWVEAKYLQIEAEIPENTCKCCDTCTGDENCLCVCDQCAFCEAAVVTQLQDEATGVTVYAESFPTGTSLSVSKIPAKKSRNQFGVPTSKQVFDMDISLRTADNRDYQPEDFVLVKVPVSAPAGTIIGILHTHNGKTTLLDVTKVQSDGTVEFVTDGFSGFAGFTVDFHYNGIDYSIEGMTSIKLSELFAAMRINESASSATSVEFSDPLLVKVTKLNDDWLLTSLSAFQSNETLVVSFDDGRTIVINVTDAETASYTYSSGTTYSVPGSGDYITIWIDYDSLKANINLSGNGTTWWIDGDGCDPNKDHGSISKTVASKSTVATIESSAPVGYKFAVRNGALYGRAIIRVVEIVTFRYNKGNIVTNTTKWPSNASGKRIGTWSIEDTAAGTVGRTNSFTISGTTPTAPGYTFKNWSYTNWAGNKVTIDVGGTAVLDETSIISGAYVDFTANWTPIQYTASFNSGGYGSNPASISFTVETGLKLPTLSRPGYTYQWKATTVGGNWTSNATYAGGATIPAGTYGNVTYTAVWTPNPNTVYTVKHYQQNIANDNYTEVTADRQTLTGATDAQVTPAVKSYTGFTAPAAQKVTIAGDGSTVVNYYYTRNSYTVTVTKGTGISGVTGGGTYKYGTSVTINATITTGYIWKNWTGYSTQTAQSYTFTMPAANVSYTANTSPSTNTAYTVKHFQQNLADSDYTEVTTDRQNLTGTTGAEVTPAVKSYTGFTAPAAQKVTIAGDGSTVVNYYYTRNSYTVTVTKGAGISGVTGGGTYKYGASVTINATITTGYIWKNWTGYSTQTAQSYTFTMPAANVTYTANADPNPNVQYTVKHYQQNPNDSNYTEVTADRQTLTGTTGQSTNAVAKSYAGFTAQSFSQTTIAADGSTVVSIYYNRNSYTVTVNKGSNVSSVSGGGTYKYGATVTINATVPVGYSWVNWTGYNTQTAQSYTFTMPAGNVTYTANAAPSTNTAYTVKHYQQNLNNSNYTEVAEDRQTLTGTTGQSTNAVAKSYAGFTAQSFSQTTIAADGSTVVSIYYNRNSYTVTVNKGSNVSSVSGGGTYKYGATVTINATVPVGYSWVNWTGYNTQTTQKYTFTMPAGNVTYTANAAPNTDTTYIVKHYLQNITDEGYYTEVAEDRQILTGTTGAEITPAVNTYEGFTAPEVQTVTILADGSLVVKYYYTRNSYTVTLNMGQGVRSVTGSGTYKYGARVTITAAMETGYSWINWTGYNTQDAKSYTFTMPAGDVTYTANGQKTAYTITYQYTGNVPAGAPAVPAAETAYYQDVVALAAPTMAAYTFSGWSNPYVTIIDGTLTMPISNVLLSGHWTANTYEATFVYGNGQPDTTVKYTAEKTISLPTPTRPGYDFDGWTVSSPDGAWPSGGSYTGSTELGMYGDVTFTAQWKVVVYDINYDLNGGTVAQENPDHFTVDTETITLNNPEKLGYLFDGWVGSNGSIAQTTVTIQKGSINDHSYTATWTPINYTVKFDGNGATSGSMQDQLFIYDQEQALRTNAYELHYTVNFDANGGESDVTSATANATFNGWTTRAKETFRRWAFFTRNELSYEDEQVVSNLTAVHGEEITLYANWLPGSVTLPSPTIYGMRLTGWYTAAEGGQKVGNAGDTYVPEENITLYAQWESVLYTITFNTDGGSAIEAITLPEGAEIPPVADPVKPNATFTGWSPEIPATMPGYDFTVTAQWVYTETLTITAGGNANETFLFTVKDTQGNVDLTVSVPGASSVTIGGLYADTYTVTEVNTWSWTRDSVAACVVTITGEDSITANRADFTMPDAAAWWLHNENHN